MDITTIVLIACGVVIMGCVYYVYSTMRAGIDDLKIKVSRLESTIRGPSEGVELESILKRRRRSNIDVPTRMSPQSRRFVRFDADVHNVDDDDDANNAQDTTTITEEFKRRLNARDDDDDGSSLLNCVNGVCSLKNKPISNNNNNNDDTDTTNN